MSEIQETEFPPAKKMKIEEECSSTAEKLSTNEDLPNHDDFTKDNVENNDKFTIDDKYNNFVTPEELEKLKEFKVLDEVKSNEGDSNDEDSDSSEGKCEDLPDEEIEKMLDANLPEELKGPPKPKEKPYVTRTKVVLEEKGINQFEILPLDWMMVRHYSGMPIYMHRPTRVCTLSKPYFLGKGNTRRHDIPISAIPCLAYRRALEEEEKQMEIDRRVEEQIKNKTWLKNQTDNDEPQNKKKSTDNPDNNMDHAEADNCIKDNEIINDSPHTIVSGSKCPFSLINQQNIERQITETETTAKTGIIPATEIGDQLTSHETEKAKSENSVDGKEKSLEVIKEEAENGDAEVVGGHGEGANEPGCSQALAIPPGRQPVVLPNGAVMPSPRVESVDTSWKTQHLTAEQINDYCKNLFKFKTVNFMHFNLGIVKEEPRSRWADRRKYTKARKALQYPKLPEGTKLITIPASSTGQENGGKVAKRDWVMNMNGCSYLSEFHEYVCRALQKQPVYEYKQLENASAPYQATVFIGGMQYGVGHGSSKRQAKYAAARASIQTLIPEMSDYLEPQPARPQEPDFSFFDYVGIEDPRIAEFCAATCEPSPHAILLTCLLRNFGAGDWHVQTEMKKLEYQKIELTMRVGKHSATVVCKNKKTAKQRASQAILQALHPHVRSWGSLLRLYGSRSVKSCKEKKLEEQQITLLQDKARRNEPNHAVLDKLRHEMRALQQRDAAVVPVGTLLLPRAPTHSASHLNNIEL